MFTGLSHVNVTVPEGTLELANDFYGNTIGLTPRPVPHLQRETLAWFDIGASTQQLHVAFGTNADLKATRHLCLGLESPEALLALQKRIWDHYARGGEAAPMAADKPGELDSGVQGVEYPKRFFARDFAGNRLEFSV